jgi:hypothetical protein
MAQVFFHGVLANGIRVVFALFIISKSGGLIYNREFHSGMNKLTSNDYLMLAGSFHGLALLQAHSWLC